MKQFKVREYGKDVYVQTLEDSKSILDGMEDYSQYSEYFQGLLEVIGKYIEEVDLILNVTEEYAMITLYLKEEQKSFAEEIKSALLNNFPEDIEQIGITQNELNIMDIFYEFFD